MQASRERILECEADYAEMHHLLTNLPPLGAMSPDELVRRAAAISQQCPPKHLLRKNRSRLVQCANCLDLNQRSLSRLSIEIAHGRNFPD